VPRRPRIATPGTPPNPGGEQSPAVPGVRGRRANVDRDLPSVPAAWFCPSAVVPSFDVLGLVALETLRVSVPTIVEAPLGRLRVETCNERLQQWSRNIVAHARIDITVEGEGNLDRGESRLVMSNHQSHFDIPVLFQALRVPLRMVAKKELYRIPLMGQAMRAAGFVEIDRSNRDAAIHQLREAGTRLHESISLWIAPEGTRSQTGRLGSFKKGGFYLAQDLGLRIQPVAINGTRDVLPAHGLTVTRGRSVRVRILPPIDPAEYAGRRDDLVLAVREAIHAGLDPEYRD
jgi:1-acyl-sn-glycerol-3-phosphate acyltransferase